MKNYNKFNLEEFVSDAYFRKWSLGELSPNDTFWENWIEINTEKNQLSWRSPIGSSLIGKEVGDTITVAIPTGQKTYEIIEIIYVQIA